MGFAAKNDVAAAILLDNWRCSVFLCFQFRWISDLKIVEETISCHIPPFCRSFEPPLRLRSLRVVNCSRLMLAGVLPGGLRLHSTPDKTPFTYRLGLGHWIPLDL